MKKNEFNKLRSLFLLYEPEITSISDFLLEDKNLSIIRIIGAEVLGIDSESLQQTAEQFKQNTQIAFNDKSTETARNQALLILIERTKLIHRVFENTKGQVVTCLFQEEPNKKAEETNYCKLSPSDRKLKRRAGYLALGRAKRAAAVDELKKLIATGGISLTTAKARDRDRLTLSIEARGADGENLGIPAEFEIEIKQFGPKLVLADSFMFIKRLGLKDNDIFAPPNGRGLKKVNYAPSPGVTFGVSYFKRGERSFDKFLRAVSPGAGVNVSFMNFDDPGFDLVKQQFTNTSGVSVDVGVGVVGMLFNNNIQLSYGYNLNAEVKRRYFGVGFSFLKIADRLGKYIPK